MKRAHIVVKPDETLPPPRVRVVVETEDGEEYALNGVRSFTKRIEAMSLATGTLVLEDFRDETVEVRPR